MTPSGRPYISADSRFVLTPANLLTLGGMVVAAVIAWQKIPNSEDVKNITKESIKQANEAADERYEQTDERLTKVEDAVTETNTELQYMNKRMDDILIVLVGSAADDMQRSRSAREAAERVRRNLKEGSDPLEGLPLSE